MKSSFFIVFFVLAVCGFSQPCPVDSSGMKQGPCTYTSVTERGTEIEVSCFYKDDKLHGPYEERYSFSGLIFREMFFVDGVLNGMYREYTPRGWLSEEHSYVNGVLNGPSKIYFRNRPVVSMEDFYVNGKLQGRLRTFYRNGKLSTYMDCLDGKCGNVYWFDLKGRLERVIVRGPDGTRAKTIYYDRKGRVVKEVLRSEEKGWYGYDDKIRFGLNKKINSLWKYLFRRRRNL